MASEDFQGPVTASDSSPSDIRNAYPELPVLQYVPTTVAMQDAVTAIGQTAYSIPIKRASYVIFRNESGSGQQGINNNYIGLQADGDRHPEKYTPLFSGTCVCREGMTGNWRRFVCFKAWQGSVQVLCGQVSDRGLFVGGFAHPYANMQINTADDWPLGYWREWVKGCATAQIPDSDKSDLLQEYQAAVGLFPPLNMFQYLWMRGSRIFGG